MKLLSHVLSLVVMLASQKCQESGDWTDEIDPSILYKWFSEDGFLDIEDIIREFEISEVPEPNITVYRQMEDRENVIVLCKFAEMFGMTFRWRSFDLSVESELNYTMELAECSSSDSSEICVYLVTVSPPASFTCVDEFAFSPDVIDRRSQTYNYSGSGGVSLFYICFFSFIAVGLFIMTAAVIVTNIRSKTKDPINPTAVTDNDYVEA
ncbi:uncharacterized protein LOC127170052 [Labeo rohita]|uniref:uncharacterized protein LOC127170052 n=1 Tax=Labeo rohita TaxID=84645 RepID=UPI0021E27D3A|nr:uncharacterized protein LOC127170052 [Labeo rohita]